MIYTENAPVSFRAALPSSAAVVVVGGGIIGVSTAWFLARAGLDVVLCEKGRVAGEQSSRNWGWVRQQGRDAAELPIMMESNDIWRTLSADIRFDVGFRQHGVLYIAETEADHQRHEEWVRLATDHGLESKLLGPTGVRDLVPDLQGNWLGGVITPSDGRAEPFETVPAMARDCVRRGVVIIENCAVRGLEFAAGRVAGVVTEHGSVRSDSVVVAGGAWSSLLLRRHDIRFPQLTVKSTVARTAPVRDVYPGNASCRGFAFRRREDGGYTLAPSGVHEHALTCDSFRFAPAFVEVLKQSWRETRLRFDGDAPGGYCSGRRWALDAESPFERRRVLNPAVDPGLVRTLSQRLAKRIPSLAGTPLVESWAGLIDATPDVVPVIDAMDAMPGLFLGSGFSGHGFGIGPAAGRILADLVQGNDPGHDLRRFRFSRFSDGSPILPGPAL